MSKNNVMMIFAALIVLGVVGALIFQQPPQPGTSGPGVSVTQPPPDTDSDSRTPGGQPPTQPTNQTRTAKPPTRIDQPAGGAPGDVDLGRFRTVDEVRQAIFGQNPVEREQGLTRLALMLEKAGSDQPDVLGEGIDLMQELFKSPDRELQDEALALMPNLDEPFRMPLLLLGMDHEDPEYRLEALSLTRDLASVNVNDALLKGMQDTDEEVLEEVSDLFFYFSDKPIYEPVIKGLTHANPMVREEALSFLEDTHTATSVRALIEHVLRSEDPEMVVTGGDALRFITDVEIDGNDYEEWKTWWDTQGEAWAAENADEEMVWDRSE